MPVVRGDGLELHVEEAFSLSRDVGLLIASLPHGWGHDKPGTRLSAARARGRAQRPPRAGRLVDPLSNNAIVNGIPVEIAPA